MLPTRDQIERAAYDRWLRRDRAHGRDRDDWVAAENELTFLLNYKVLVEYRLELPESVILGNLPARRCRFCERTPYHTPFSAARHVVQGTGKTSLFSAEVCDECQADCRDPLAGHCQGLWDALNSDADAFPILPGHLNLMAVFKSLIASALLIMPGSELVYFTDTLEWLNNPDHGYDGGLFAGTFCHVYRAAFLRDQSWTSLARRIDEEAPFPYMVYFVARGGTVIQVSVPLCVRDQDLDGRGARTPERSLTAGEGPKFAESRSAQLPLVGSGNRQRAEDWQEAHAGRPRVA
jgi:hypothetical protein